MRTLSALLLTPTLRNAHSKTRYIYTVYWLVVTVVVVVVVVVIIIVAVVIVIVAVVDDNDDVGRAVVGRKHCLACCLHTREC